MGVAAGAACTVSTREELIGRYVDAGDEGRESWTLAPDGTCEIVRTEAGAPARTRCEWELVERDGRRRLTVTLLAGPADDPVRHRTRLVLTPSRVLGAIRIPLDRGRELKKAE
jgi:hypothetical protein